MKVLKHGNAVKEFTFTCNKCGCEFSVLSTEYKSYKVHVGTDDRTRMGPDYIIVKVMSCPECLQIIDVLRDGDSKYYSYDLPMSVLPFHYIEKFLKEF